MFTMDHNIWWRTLGLSASVSTPHDVLIQVFRIPDNLVLHETLYTIQGNELVAVLKGASNTSVVTSLTELAVRLGKGEGLDKPVVLLRNMLSHDMEEALRIIRTYVALVAEVSFVQGTDVLRVGKDPKGESESSKEASRSLVRALSASCLGEDLRGMVDENNRSSAKAATFDELTHWLHGEVGGKFPLTSYLEGLGSLLSGKEWTADTFSMRLADMKLLGGKVASTSALYMEGHRPNLISMWKTFFGEGPRSGEGGGSKVESKGDEEFEREIEEELSAWKEAEVLKLEEWERPGNFQLVIEKATKEARAQVDRVAAEIEQGDEKQPLIFGDVLNKKTIFLLGAASQKGKDLEERLKAKQRELRRTKKSNKGARPSQAGGFEGFERETSVSGR